MGRQAGESTSLPDPGISPRQYTGQWVGDSVTPPPSYSSTAQLTRQLLSVSSVLGPVLGGCLPATDMCPTGV